MIQTLETYVGTSVLISWFKSPHYLYKSIGLAYPKAFLRLDFLHENLFALVGYSILEIVEIYIPSLIKINLFPKVLDYFLYCIVCSDISSFLFRSDSGTLIILIPFFT